MKSAILTGALVVLLTEGTSLNAQQDSVLRFSLSEAQQYAIENYYMSKNAGLDVQSAKWRVWGTTALGLPQVSATASYQHIPGEIPVFDFQIPGMDTLGIDFGEPSAIAVRNSVTYGLTVTQLLFSGEYIVGLQASKVYKSMSEEVNEKSAIEIKRSVADSYFGLLILTSNREILDKTLTNLKNNLFQIEKAFQVGLVEDTEVDQIGLIVKRTENSLASLDRQIEFMTNLFKYQIGLEPETKIELINTIDELIAENIVNDSAYTFILEDNIDYQMLSTQERLQELLMRRAQSRYLPSVAGFYQYQDKTQKADFDFTINHILGVSVDFPIVTSGSRMAQVSQARIEYEKACNTREQEVNRLYMTARQASFDYRTALEKYNNEKLNFELSEKVYNKTSEKYKQGFVSSLELSLINNQYLQAQLSYSMAVQELLSAKVSLDKAYNML
jgi:outer membrane protein TolC